MKAIDEIKAHNFSIAYVCTKHTNNAFWCIYVITLTTSEFGNNSILFCQQLGWQQYVTPLITRQYRVVLYPPYPIGYNTLSYFVPMHLNMYPPYYYRIKGLDPLISRRKEQYATSINQLEPVPLVKH